MYPISCLIKLVRDLRHVGGFLPVSSTNKTDRHDITEINNITSPHRYHVSYFVDQAT